MHAQDSLVYYSCNGQVIEHVTKLSPQRYCVASLALVVKSVHTSNGVALMVASQQEDHVWKLDFIGYQQADSFNALFASVYEVANKKVLVLGRRTSGQIEQS